MMKKSLTQAIALAASLGAAASAHAVNVNSDGLGQALIYPVYTVDAGNDTYVSITNTTNQYKAVKVRFLEGQNSLEVLDFNLYLSPNDVWNGSLVREGTETVLRTADTSCTAPRIDNRPNGAQFRGNAWNPAAEEIVPAGPRGQVGYVEVIEMGVVKAPNGTIAAEEGVAVAADDDEIAFVELLRNTIKHVNGKPAGVDNACDTIGAQFVGSRPWNTLGINYGLDAPAGGLYGLGTIINVARGTSIGVDPVALDNLVVGGAAIHARTGDIRPNLTQATGVATFKNGDSAVFNNAGGSTAGLKAVSSVLMKEAIANDYAVIDGFIGTEWVVNFPTKGLHAGTAPFAGMTSNCLVFGVEHFDREEGEPARPVEGIDFSPMPKEPTVPPLSLCSENTIVGINGSAFLASSDNTFVHKNLELEFDAGWLTMDFTAPVRTTPIAGERELSGVDPADMSTAVVTHGLPVIGLAVSEFINEDAADGLLANYAASWVHKATTTHDVYGQ